MGAIVTGLLFGLVVGLAVSNPNPVSIGSSVTCGAFFLINLVKGQ